LIEIESLVASRATRFFPSISLGDDQLIGVENSKRVVLGKMSK